MVVKRDRLPKPSDRRANFLDAWAEPDGRLGMEVNDHGTIYGLLLQVDTALAEAVEKLRGQPVKKPPATKVVSATKIAKRAEFGILRDLLGILQDFYHFSPEGCQT